MVNETVADFYLTRMFNTGDSINNLVNLMNVRQSFSPVQLLQYQVLERAHAPLSCGQQTDGVVCRLKLRHRQHSASARRCSGDITMLMQ